MNTDLPFHNYFSTHELDKEVVEKLTLELSPIKLCKGEVFIDYRDKVNKIGILINGLLISKYIDSCENEYVSKFYHNQGDNIVVDLNAFNKEQLSSEKIYAFEDSMLMTISRTSFLKLKKEHSVIRDLSNSLAEESYIKALHRIRSLQKVDNKEKIKDFRNTHNSIINRLNIKDIASYLGMSRNVYTNNLKQI